jgi:hypothetical protein
MHYRLQQQCERPSPGVPPRPATLAAFALATLLALLLPTCATQVHLESWSLFEHKDASDAVAPQQALPPKRKVRKFLAVPPALFRGREMIVLMQSAARRACVAWAAVWCCCHQPATNTFVSSNQLTLGGRSRRSANPALQGHCSRRGDPHEHGRVSQARIASSNIQGGQSVDCLTTGAKLCVPAALLS